MNWDGNRGELDGVQRQGQVAVGKLDLEVVKGKRPNCLAFFRRGTDTPRMRPSAKLIGGPSSSNRGMLKGVPERRCGGFSG